MIAYITFHECIHHMNQCYLKNWRIELGAQGHVEAEN